MKQTVEINTNQIIIDQFNEAFIKHDYTLLKDIIDAYCLMEGASPPPAGYELVEVATKGGEIIMKMEKTFMHPGLQCFVINSVLTGSCFVENNISNLYSY